VAKAARERARATGLPHNHAREVFRKWLIAGLTERAVDRIGKGWLNNRDTALRAELGADVRFELSGSPQVRDAVDLLWPHLTPQRLLADLYTSRSRIDVAAASLAEADRAALFREAGEEWTVSDVPLLDEAAELLGADRSADKRAALEHRKCLDYARGVLQILDTDAEFDGETLRAVDLINAEALSARHAERDRRDLADRAAADREWTYGHVVIDEAQELSEMDWRVIMRRCPSKSMTIVGDLAQRQSPAGAHTWGDMLDRYALHRWTYRRLTINYRTPAEIMEVAARVLAEINPALAPPESVRHSGHRPSSRQVDFGELATAVVEVIHDRPEGGSLAVIVPDGLRFDVGIPLLTPKESKGLEFDVVVVVEPQRILTQRRAGAAELYVALTRATQRLHLIHTQPLPQVLNGVVECLAVSEAPIS
jgi:DNA helicase IV